jgi:hypothetical protein
MPRCVFGDGSYRCTKRGIGNPPLCREHYKIIADAEAIEEEEGSERDFLQDLLERLMDHPFVQNKVEEVVQILRDPARRSPHYQGPGRAYAAEAPPRQRVEQRRPPPPPAQPRNGLSALEAREILHFSPDQTLSSDQIRKRQRQLARLAHPDVGGSEAAMRRVNAAATLLLSQLR